jgi:prevent-host-death family protein
MEDGRQSDRQSRCRRAKLNLVHSTKTVNIHSAKTHLSSLVEEAAAGEEITGAKAGKPVARLVPLQPQRFDRRPGRVKHLVQVHENFDDPLPPEIAAAFGVDR